MIRMMVLPRWFLVFCLVICAAQTAGAAVDDVICGKLANGYGPFDYRSNKAELPVVEFHHLTPVVVNLVSGQTGVFPGGDLDYTLRAFPNHPTALMAMLRLGDKTQMDKPKGARYSVECYLYRAWRFREDDPTVRMIYATYLAKRGRSSEALSHLEDAVAMGEESANLDYNLGLIYANLKKYDEALVYAHKAYLQGFPLPGLRDKLKKAGKWKDPVIPVESTAEIKLENEVHKEPTPLKN
jgi:tetratricopeptide (TPR) repeat protein